MIGGWPQRSTIEGVKTLELGTQEEGSRLGKLNLGRERVWASDYPPVSRRSVPVTVAVCGSLPTLGKFLLCPCWSLPVPQALGVWGLLPILLLHMMARKGLVRPY